jgi:hypothetical protein
LPEEIKPGFERNLKSLFPEIIGSFSAFFTQQLKQKVQRLEPETPEFQDLSQLET